MKLSLTAMILLPLLSSTGLAEPLIGVFGDIHGNKPAAEAVLRHLKAMSARYVIGTGDFIERGGAQQLEEMLGLITELSGVPKERVYLLPGNWEHETTLLPEEANAILRKYGHLVFENYASYGYLTLEGRKLMLAHFPQHEVPSGFLPPSSS